MKNFDYYSPTYFSFGRGKEKNVGILIKKYGGSKVLLHYGGGSVKKNGIYQKIVEVLNESKIPFVELGASCIIQI